MQVNSLRAHLPIYLNGGSLQIFQSGGSAVVVTEFHLRMSYDWSQQLRITVSSALQGRLCGLCGNYNDDPGDDFQTPAGTMAPDANAFGKSWKVDVGDQDACWDDCHGPCVPCQADQAQKYQSEQYCGLIKAPGGPFSPCHSKVDPGFYLEGCVYDICANEGHRQSVCDALESYADACQKHGRISKEMPSHHLRSCPFNGCPPNSQYQQCGTACPATCLDEQTQQQLLCPAVCIEGCHCLPGYVLSQDKCIPKSSCGCLHEGYLYAPNEGFWADDKCTKRCVCNPATNRVECTQQACKSSEKCLVIKGVRDCYPIDFVSCKIHGDPHYFTFDKYKFDFQGPCAYVLTEVCEKSVDLNWFGIYVQNEYRGNRAVSWTRSVQINVHATEIIIIWVVSGYYNLDPGVGFKNSSNRFAACLLGRRGLGGCGLLEFLGGPFFCLSKGLEASPGPLGGPSGSRKQAHFQTSGRPVFPPPRASTQTLHLPAWKMDHGPASQFKYWFGKPDENLTSGSPEPVQTVVRMQYCRLTLSTIGSSIRPAQITVPGTYRNTLCGLCGNFNNIPADDALVPGGILVPTIPVFGAKGTKAVDPSCKQVVDPACPGVDVLAKQQRASGRECGLIVAINGPFRECHGHVDQEAAFQDCIYDSCYLKGRYAFVCAAITNYVLACQAAGITIYPWRTPTFCRESLGCKLGALTWGRKSVIWPNQGSVQLPGNFTPPLSGPLWECPCLKMAWVRSASGLTLCLSAGHKSDHLILGHCDRRKYEPLHVVLPTVTMNFVLNNVTRHVAASISQLLTPPSVKRIVSAMTTLFGVTTRVYQWQSVAASIKGATIRSLKCSIQLAKNVASARLAAKWCVKRPLVVPMKYASYKMDTRNATPLEVPPVLLHLLLHPKQVIVHHKGCEPATFYCSDTESGLGEWKHRSAQGGHGGDVELCAFSVARQVGICPGEFLNPVHWRRCVCGVVVVIAFSLCWGKLNPCRIIFTTGSFPEETEMAQGIQLEQASQLISWVFFGCPAQENGAEKQVSGVAREWDCAILQCPSPATPTNPHTPSHATPIKPCAQKREQLKSIAQPTRASTDPQPTGTMLPPPTSTSSPDDPHLTNVSILLPPLPLLLPPLPHLPLPLPLHLLSSSSSFSVFHEDIILFRQVNGVLHRLPVNLLDGKLRIYQYGFYQRIETFFGVTVIFDLSFNVRITVPNNYKDQLGGLCGNYNGQPQDDLQLPDGTVVSDVGIFAAAWKIQTPGIFCTDGCSGKNCPICTEAKKEFFKQRSFCGILTATDGPFSSCHGVVDPTAYLNHCVFDLCIGGGDRQILCHSIQSYVAACQGAKVTIQPWRSPDFCREANKEDPANQLGLRRQRINGGGTSQRWYSELLKVSATGSPELIRTC
ncbi:Zonadhesin, partial [Ophiophagus hannah]